MTASESGVDIEGWLGADGSDMPALPRVVAELASLASDPEMACNQLAEVVVREPVLAARMLRLVNSAYFGLAQKVTDIRHAVYLLGTRTVRTVALTAGVLSAFRDVPSDPFDLDRFWRHSISAAAACAAVARRSRACDSETAFTVGLLHDVGKLVLVRYRPNDARAVIDRARQQSLSFYQSERDLLPVAHPQLGAWLGQRWNLPLLLVEGLANHHTARSGELPQLDAALKFANYLCAVKGLTTSGSFGQAALSPETWYGLGLTSEALPPLLEAINTEIATAEDLLRNA